MSNISVTANRDKKAGLEGSPSVALSLPETQPETHDLRDLGDLVRLELADTTKELCRGNRHNALGVKGPRAEKR